MAKKEFREEDFRAPAKPLSWEMYIEILDVIWGDDMHSSLNVAGGIQASWTDKDNVRYEAESFEEIEGAYKLEDISKLIISRYIRDPKFEAYLSFDLLKNFVYFTIISIDKEDVNRAIAILKKYFPLEIKISEPNSKENYVHSSRINELISISSSKFDLAKLIRYCDELNIAYSNDCYFSTLMLVRSIINHVPPIFGASSFKEVVSQHGGQSFKDSMNNLEKSSRKIADSYLHEHIRNKEVLPNSNQVKFIQELDVLLSEVFRILKS